MLAAQVAMNTTIAAATGGLVVFIVRLLMTKSLGEHGGTCGALYVPVGRTSRDTLGDAWCSMVVR